MEVYAHLVKPLNEALESIHNLWIERLPVEQFEYSAKIKILTFFNRRNYEVDEN
jgi:hypothetical protein